jgi:hypothetical protein
MKCFPITLSLAIALLFVADPASAGTPVQQLTADAMRECALGRQAQTRTERVQHFTQGQAFGEQAVEKDDLSPDAHFSLFCNLGEQLRIDGESPDLALRLPTHDEGIEPHPRTGSGSFGCPLSQGNRSGAHSGIHGWG